MNKTLRLFILSGLISFSPLFGATAAPEDWKGAQRESNLTLGSSAGIAIVDGSVGFSLLGAAGLKIVHHGFISEDINDQVFAEVQMGPVMVKSTTGFLLSAHARWDFHRNETLTLFAVGGVSGLVISQTSQFFPRFGLGCFYRFTDLVSLRVDFSHEWVTAGASFEL